MIEEAALFLVSTVEEVEFIRFGPISSFKVVLELLSPMRESTLVGRLGLSPCLKPSKQTVVNQVN